MPDGHRVDRIPARCAVAERYGATVIDGSAQDDEAAVRALLPDGAPVVLQAAGSQAALELCLRVVAADGRVANVGTLPTLSGFDLFWSMQLSGASLLPIYRPPVVNARTEHAALGTVLRARYLPDVIDMLRRGRLDIAALCTWCVPAEQAPAGFSLLREHPDRCLGMALAWDESQVRGQEDFARALTQP